MIRHLALCAALMLSACTTAPSEVRYAVTAGGAVSMKQIVKPSGALINYPWEDPNEIIYSSCGFADVTFDDFDRAIPTYEVRSEDLKRHRYRVMTGHWCQVGPALLEQPGPRHHLIAYVVWKGARYKLTSTPVYTTADGRDYVAEKDVIEYLSLVPLLEDVTKAAAADSDSSWTDENTGCFDSEGIDNLFSAAQQAELLTAVGDRMCYRLGVFLSRILMPANNTLQRRGAR